jgi:hypothetical protein
MLTSYWVATPYPLRLKGVSVLPIVRNTAYSPQAKITGHASMAAIVTVTHPISDEGRTLVHEAGRVSLAFSVGCTLSSTLDQWLGALLVARAHQPVDAHVTSVPCAAFIGGGHLSNALVTVARASSFAGLAADTAPTAPHRYGRGLTHLLDLVTLEAGRANVTPCAGTAGYDSRFLASPPNAFEAVLARSGRVAFATAADLRRRNG